VQQTRKLVEEDKVFALFGGLGTEPQQAVVDYLNQRKVPQLLVSTGATEFSADYKAKPYTIGWQPDYFAEGVIYGKYAAQNWPTKKIGVLYQSDDYGKNYLEGLKSGLGSKASNIITTQGVAVTDASVAQQVVAIRQSGADVIAILATPSPTVKTFATMKALKYRPEQVILNSVSANDVVMGLAFCQLRRHDTRRCDQHCLSDEFERPEVCEHRIGEALQGADGEVGAERGCEEHVLLLRLREGLRRRKAARRDGQESDAGEGPRGRPAHELDEPRSPSRASR
jgi:hypothetical protein